MRERETERERGRERKTKDKVVQENSILLISRQCIDRERLCVRVCVRERENWRDAFMSRASSATKIEHGIKYHRMKSGNWNNLTHVLLIQFF